MDDAERREIKELADDVVSGLEKLGILDCSDATEWDIIMATAIAYMIDDGAHSLTEKEAQEYIDRAAYNSKLADKWLHAEKLTPH